MLIKQLVILVVFNHCAFQGSADDISPTTASNRNKKSSNGGIKENCVQDAAADFLANVLADCVEAVGTGETAEAEEAVLPPNTFSPLTKLQLDLDRNRMMHRLAAHYYDYQNFWFLFVPSVGITMASGIVASLSDSSTLTAWFSGEFRALLNTSVGVMSIVSVFFQTMGKELDYGHRSKEHEGVALELRTLYDKMKFEELALREDPTRGDSLADIVKLYEEKYEQVMTGCSSAIPTAIYNSYELAFSRLELYIFPPVLGGGDQLSESRIDWIRAMGIVNNEVFNAFGSYTWWPMRMPSAEAAVEKAFDNLNRVLKNDRGSSVAASTSIGSVYRLILEQQKGIKMVNSQLEGESNAANDKIEL